MKYNKSIIKWCLEHAEFVYGCHLIRSSDGWNIDFISLMGLPLVSFEKMLKSKQHMKLVFLLAIEWVNTTHKKIYINPYDQEEKWSEQFRGVYVCDILFEEVKTLYEALEFVYYYPNLLRRPSGGRRIK